MIWQKPSTMLAFAGWVSLFALTWLLVLGKIQSTGPTWTAWLFFCVVAVFSSAISVGRHERQDPPATSRE